MLKRIVVDLLVIVVASTSLWPMLAQTRGVSPATAQMPVAAERNPPGDIPDSQAFVNYTSPPRFFNQGARRLGAS